MTQLHLFACLFVKGLTIGRGLLPACWCWCRIATLREAFRNTPTWLGFNIELKYPTEAQLAAMPTRFYSRNYFCDSILKVIPVLLRSHSVLAMLHGTGCETRVQVYGCGHRSMVLVANVSRLCWRRQAQGRSSSARLTLTAPPSSA